MGKTTLNQVRNSNMRLYEYLWSDDLLFWVTVLCIAGGLEASWISITSSNLLVVANKIVPRCLQCLLGWRNHLWLWITDSKKKKDIKVTFILWLQIYPSLFLKIKEAKILDKFIIEEQLHSVVGRFKFSFLPIIKYL